MTNSTREGGPATLPVLPLALFDSSGLLRPGGDEARSGHEPLMSLASFPITNHDPPEP
jgi:hypothetical protein